MAQLGGGMGRQQVINERSRKPVPKRRLVKKGYTKSKKVNYGQPAQNTAKRNNPAPKRSVVRAPAKSKASYKAPKRQTFTSRAPAKRSGGATGAGGKFYRNGYVDSKGNRVVNGKWQSPKASSPKRSASTAKATSQASAPAPTARMSIAAVPEVTKPKVAMLADDYLDQIYRNQIAELDAADEAFIEDTAAKVGRLGRDYETNKGHVNLNKTNSLQNSAEDFAARGMMRSGAYQTNMAKSNKNFDDQQARMLQNKNDDESQFARAKADYLRGSRTQRQDSKRQQADRNAVENAKRAAQNSS